MTTLIVVDVQNDFVEGGSLGVDGGRKVAERVDNFCESVGFMLDRIVATRDFHAQHNDNGGHFSNTPDYQDTWPAHCVEGTEGAEYAWSAEHYATEHVRKGWGEPAYSAFEGFDSVTQQAFTVERGEIVWVCGIATDYCVKQTVLDALRAGASVVVLSKYCAAVGDQDKALAELESAGAKIVN